MSNIAALVVDDDRAIRVLFNHIMKKGLEMPVDFAIGGYEAIDKLAQREYAVIILDLQMKEMNGQEFMDYLERNHPDYLKRTIVVSAAGQTVTDKIDFSRVHAYIPKPFDLDYMKATINDVVCAYAMRDSSRRTTI
jgi:DNA-binding NtrC family response regulator